MYILIRVAIYYKLFMKRVKEMYYIIKQDCGELSSFSGRSFVNVYIKMSTSVKYSY